MVVGSLKMSQLAAKSSETLERFFCWNPVSLETPTFLTITTPTSRKVTWSSCCLFLKPAVTWLKQLVLHMTLQGGGRGFGSKNSIAQRKCLSCEEAALETWDVKFVKD